MESRRIVAGALVVAAALMFVATSVVFSCIPDDTGKCESLHARARIGLLGGGRGNALILLTANQNELQESVLEYANVHYQTGYAQNDTGKPFNGSSQLAPNEKIRSLTNLSLSAMTDAELELSLNNLYETYPDDSLNRSIRIANINTEILSRQVERWVASRIVLKAVTQPVAKAPVKPKPVVPKTVKPAAAAAPAAPAPAAPAADHNAAPAIPGSADPWNSPMPSGQQAYIEPHSTVWYSMSDRGRRLNISMDADPQLGLRLVVFGPDRTDVWSGKPTGQAAKGNGHNYFWTGRARFKGIWRIRLTNPNDFSVPYTLTGENISDKGGDLCRNCHGNIGGDEFDRCEHEGSFCDDLKDQAQNKGE